jgi:hypothetical protein
MGAKDEEFPEMKVAGWGHEWKRRLSDESESDRKPVSERDERTAEGVLQPVGKIIGLPPAAGREAISLRVKL